ncbi:cytochrome P450 [Daedaleopsis nitida]|nr:cytochrome P450 [Daedaleopsis nitida]
MAVASDIVILGICLFSAVAFFKWPARRKAKLPPGPSTLPIIGSVHHLTFEFQEKLFARLSQRFGDVMYLRLFQTPAIVLNTLGGARDLLDKRGANYADRPRMVLQGDMIGQDTSTAVMQYDDRLRKRRRWLHEALIKTTALTTYQPVRQRELHILLRNLLETPDAFIEHLYRYVVATLLEITYGQQMNSMQDELVQLAERALTAIVDSGSPGTMLVDFFPVLKYIPAWMPGAGFKRRAMVGRKYLTAWRNRGVDIVKDAMAAGNAAPCIIASLLEAHENGLSADDLEDIRGTGVDIYGAGLETTFSTLLTFVLAMVRNPDALRKAQDEIDRVVGRDRLPDFADRGSLPYINAVLEEVYRWNPGLPLVLPHRSIADDEYHGYNIPAGTVVMPNVWAITRDTNLFTDPEEFCPERHLVENKATQAKEVPSSFVFGFGRRWGRSLACC